MKKWNEVLRLFRRSTHTHTLAQNGHCELWSGLYLTCKNSSVTWKDWTGCLRETSCLFWMVTEGCKKKHNETNQITTTIQEMIQIIEVGKVVLGVATSHGEYTENVKPENSKIAGTSSWPSWISHFTGSFVGHSTSEMLSPCVLRNPRENFTAVQMVHTHTHTLSQEGGKIRPGQWDEHEDEKRMRMKWKWTEDDMKVT